MPGQRFYDSEGQIYMQSTQILDTNESFINEVITEAKKSFISGYQSNNNFRAKADQNVELQAQYNLSMRFIAIKNEPFLGNRTRIPGTNFIASSGPQNITQLKNLINDTAFHKNPTYQIVALGSYLGYENNTNQDFLDYCLKERVLECDPYQIKIERVSGEATSINQGNKIIAENIVSSKLFINNANENIQKQLNVSVFKVYDDTSIQIYHPENNSIDEQIKEALWQLFQISQREQILVHCAAGVGRTGHFILTMEILKHYKTIFANNDPIKASEEIHKILTNMRNVRLALVTSPQQFNYAIYNAYAVYQYALKKNYILTEKPVIEIKNEIPMAAESLDTKKEVISPVSIFAQKKNSEGNEQKNNELHKHHKKNRCTIL